MSDDWLAEVPSDLEATLTQLRTSFPYTTTLLSIHSTQQHIQLQPPSILLLSHIYTVLTNTSRTEIDRELDSAVKDNKIRKFILLNQVTAYVLIDDYVAKLQQLVNIDTYKSILSQQTQQAQKRSTAVNHTQSTKTATVKCEDTLEHSNSSNDVELYHQRSNQAKRRRLNSADNDTIDLTSEHSTVNTKIDDTELNVEYDHCLTIYYVITKLLPQCTTTHITKSQLFNILYTDVQSQYRYSTFENIISFLIRNSILLQSHIESQYVFTIPYSSQYINDLFNGRKEVIALLKKKQYKMISYRQFEKIKLKTTKLSVRYIVDSLLGDYTVTFMLPLHQHRLLLNHH